MTLTLHIPTWLLWTLGVSLATVILILAVIGIWAIWVWFEFKP